MGYESKLYICKRVKIGDSAFWNETLAAINMCKMGSDFYSLFTNKLDGEFYGMDGAMSRFDPQADESEPELVDNYGDELKYTSLSDVLDWCDGYMENDSDDKYWRIITLRDILFSLKYCSPIPLDELIVVHYGY